LWEAAAQAAAQQILPVKAEGVLAVIFLQPVMQCPPVWHTQSQWVQVPQVDQLWVHQDLTVCLIS
jgi:hypothetical protein